MYKIIVSTIKNLEISLNELEKSNKDIYKVMPCVKNGETEYVIIYKEY